MKKLNIMVVTTSRADYGLLYPLIKKMKEDGYFNLYLIATGAHLSSFHGSTIEKIKEAGFIVDSIVDLNQKGDTENDLCNSIAIGINGFSRIIIEYEPDAVLVLGDRYELWSVCIPAVIHKVPIIHLHGGEATHGLVDDPIRHSITKMASVHFPSIDIYGKRIIQMGEEPENIYIVGALGIDNIKNIDLMDKKALSEYIGIDFANKDVALMTYHPVTLEEYGAGSLQVREILEALLETQLFTLITMPNSDTGSNEIYKVKAEFVKLFPEKFKMVKNLGQRAYLSAMKHSKLMIGNSSSGIIESASFRLPVVNVGDRQAGRFKPINVIDTICSKEYILKAINRALSDEFINSISELDNPYGDGNTAERIVKILKSINFADKSRILKKGFFDLDFTKLDEISKRRIIK